MTVEKILHEFENINYCYNDCTRYDTLKRMLNELVESSCEQKWIPVSERLPEEKQVVLISNGKGHVRCGQYQHLLRDSDPTKWWWKNKTIETVIAWMPLPSPYSDPTPQEGEKDD